MDIKKIGCLCVLFLSLSLFGKDQEEQRKYGIPANSNFKAHVLTSMPFGEMKSKFHSSYLYTDIYLDTPTRDLYRHNLSLRFRKRMTDTLVEGYDFQLKNELTETNTVRLEIDEGELDFYRLKLGADWVSLPSVLDILFSYSQGPKKALDSLAYQNALDALQWWIFQKVDAPITPFQKLKHLAPDLFTTANLQSLSPAVIGFSTRYRSHIYYEKNDSLNPYATLPLNRLKKENLPPYFVENNEAVWVLETSLDESTFFLLEKGFQTKKMALYEYEVENKHSNAELGTRFLDSLEKELIQLFQLVPMRASKYKQSINFFINN